MFIYVISAGPLAQKIGISKNPGDRLAALQTGHYARLSLEFARSSRDAQAVERAAHQAAEVYRLNGEWFSISPELAVSLVKSVINRLDGQPDDEWSAIGGWSHKIGDRVICRWSDYPGWPEPLPIVGETYTVAHVYEDGQIDLAELPSDLMAYCPSMFRPMALG